MKIARTLTCLASSAAIVAASLLAVSSAQADDETTAGPAMTSAPVAPDAAAFDENRSLSVTAAQERLAVITEKYTDVGDVLSDADAEFIKIYALGGTDPVLDGRSDPDDIKTRGTATASFDRSGKGAGGTGRVKGSQSTTIGPGISNKFSTSYTATGGGTVNKIKACSHVKGWGLVGATGVGLVYYYDPCGTVNGKTNNFSRSASYNGLVAYATIQYDAIFYTPTGSFQLAG